MILEITISLVSIKKSLYQYHPTYTRRVSSHRVLYLKLLSIYNICIIYLHVTKGCLKVTIVIIYFCHSQILSDVVKYIFNSISIYFWKKILLTNIRNKSVIGKINLYFFDVMKNGHIFPSKVCHFQYDHGFLFSRETVNIREYKEVRLKKKWSHFSSFHVPFLSYGP